MPVDAEDCLGDAEGEHVDEADERHEQHRDAAEVGRLPWNVSIAVAAMPTVTTVSHGTSSTGSSRTPV